MQKYIVAIAFTLAASVAHAQKADRDMQSRAGLAIRNAQEAS